MSAPEKISAEFNAIVEGLRPYLSSGATITVENDTVIIHGDLEVHNQPVPKLPRYLHVKGSCYLENAGLHDGELPEVLIVDHHLFVTENEHLSRLPPITHVGCDTNLIDTGITSLPDNFNTGTGAIVIFLPDGYNCFSAEHAREVLRQQQIQAAEQTGMEILQKQINTIFS